MNTKLLNMPSMNMKPMKEVLYIVVHASSTSVNHKVTVDDIDRMHKARNFACCGYHWIILQDGTIQPGRSEKYAGAHVKHYNEHAIGVCYIGGKDARGRYGDTRTPEQKASLHFLLKDLRQSYPRAKIVGHRDFPNVRKQCPCFDVQSEYAIL